VIGAVDLELAGLARRQHGLWTRTQALSAGASGSLIDRRLRSGAWLRLDTSVYGSPAARATWHRSVMAAVLAERVAIASHRTAAALFALAGFRPGRPHVTIPAGAHARGRLSIAHRSVSLRATVVDDIPCVTIEQVFIDLAQCVSVDRLRMALARRADREPSVIDRVRDRYVELAPRGGRDLRRLRAVLDRFGSGETIKESELERLARHVLQHPELPLVVWQAPFPGREVGACRVDGLIPAWGIVIELDGRAWHARVDDFERDRRRDQAAAAAGLLTLRFTYAQIAYDPEWCLTVLREAGARRAGAILAAG
jgi:hypothetical protein